MSFSELWKGRRSERGKTQGAILKAEELETRLALSSVPTLTTLMASNSNPSMGQTLVLTAEVSQGMAPTGSIQFFDNGMPLGTSTLENGKASIDVKLMPFGMNTVTAEYLGDSKNAASLSGQVPVAFGNTFERFMNDAHRGLIGTPASAEEMQAYDRQLSVTHNRKPMVVNLMYSPSGQQHMVQDEFAIYMERAATPKEVLQTLKSARRLGGSIQAAIVGSHLFYQTWSGNTVDGYLKVLESSTTGVPFTSSQRAKLASEIAHGVPLTRVAYQAFSFQSAKIATTQFLYESYLGRPATSAELAKAIKPPGRPVNTLGMQIALFSTDEFFNAVGSPSVTGTTTTLTVTQGPTAVTLTATVKPSNAISLGPIRGLVTFMSGTTVLGTAVLNTPQVGIGNFVPTPPSGVTASLTTTLPPGTRDIVARYEGDVAFAGSTSPVLNGF
ncbi:Ig-like domain-containing protein [Singulisphaera rosea]